MFWIAALLIFIFTLVTSLIESRLKTGRRCKVFILPIAAVFAFFAGHSIDFIQKKFEKPKVQIRTNRMAEGIKIEIEVDKKSIESITLDYTLAGHIIGFENPNSVADVHTSAWVVGGQTDEWLLNRIEIELMKIKPKTKLSYLVKFTDHDKLKRLFEKMPKNKYTKTIKELVSESRDKYKLSYRWNFKGETFYESHWRLTENDQIAQPPKIRTGGWLYYVPTYKAPPPQFVPKSELSDTF